MRNQNISTVKEIGKLPWELNIISSSDEEDNDSSDESSDEEGEEEEDEPDPTQNTDLSEIEKDCEKRKKA